MSSTWALDGDDDEGANHLGLNRCFHLVSDPMVLQIVKDGWQASTEFVNNKLKGEVRDFLRKHAEADLFIITSTGGVGKSSFFKSITGEDIYVGSTLRSGTTTATLIPTVIGNKRCLFMDMPGFNTKDFDDWDVFKRLISGLSVVWPYCQFHGLLYVDEMLANCITPATVKILNWLFYFCGATFMPNVTVVTTRWDGLDDDGIETKTALFKSWKDDTLLQQLFSNGASTYYHRLVEESGHYRTLHINRRSDQRREQARAMITDQYQGSTDLQLRIYIEIANGASLESTQAGRWLKFGHAENISTEDAGEEGSQHQEADQASDENSESSALRGWGEFWSDLECIKPWARLLVRAAKIYIRSSSSTNSSFPHGAFSAGFDEDDNAFGSLPSSGIFHMFVDEDGDIHSSLNDSPDDSDSWCQIM